MASERVISIPNKPHISNYGSKLLLQLREPGLADVVYASGRMARGRKPHANIVLLGADGKPVRAKIVKLTWKPHRIDAEFAFPNGLRVKQKSWVDGAFAHATLTLVGNLAGATLAAEGVSYQAAKAIVSPSNTVMVEEIDPAFKPFVLEVASSVAPGKVQLSSDGKNWTDSGFAWSEQAVHYRMLFDGLPSSMTVSIHLGKLSNWLSAQEWAKARGRETSVRREWERAFTGEFPDIECPDRRFRDLLQYCLYVHRSSVLELDGMLPYPFVVPSKLAYPAWWMWDTAFHSMHDAWMKDPSLAHGDLLNHTIMQSRKGCIQDAGGEFYGDTGDGRWIPPEFYDGTKAPCTGPCVTGIAVWDVYEKTGSLEFLKKMFPNLVIYERWLLQAKASGLDPDLIAYTNWYDVGWDDSKRWGKTGMKDVPDSKVDWDLPVVPVDGNVFFLILRENLGKIAGILGDKERQAEYAAKAAQTKRAIDQRMWNEKEGFYFDLLPDGKMLDVWTPAGFTPMLAGIPGNDTYHRLREHLLDPKKFWSKYPIPTLAMDDPDFDLIYWRGPMWPVVNWQVNEGLFRYDRELGLRLVMSTVEMMTKDGHPNCTEHYNPTTGAPGGAIDQGWGTMPVDLILRRIFGLNPKPDCLELDPYLPADWPEASVRNVFVAGTSVQVRYSRAKGGLVASVKNTGHKELTVKAGRKWLSLKPSEEGALDV